MLLKIQPSTSSAVSDGQRQLSAKRRLWLKLRKKMTQNENYKKVFGISFVSGGFAGIVAKTAVAPLERIKIIYQTSSIPFTYSSALTKAADLYKQNGFLTFYRGNLPNILRITPYSAIQFALFDLLKNLFITKEETSLQLKLKHFLFGSISGLTATIIMHP